MFSIGRRNHRSLAFVPYRQGSTSTLKQKLPNIVSTTSLRVLNIQELRTLFSEEDNKIVDNLTGETQIYSPITIILACAIYKWSPSDVPK